MKNENKFRGNSLQNKGLLLYFRIIYIALISIIITTSSFAEDDPVRSKDIAVYKFEPKERTPGPTESSKDSIQEEHHKNMRALADVPAVITLPEKLVKLENDMLVDTDKAEKLIFERGAVYEDAEVTDYINGVGGRILSGTDINIGTDVRF